MLINVGRIVLSSDCFTGKLHVSCLVTEAFPLSQIEKNGTANGTVSFTKVENELLSQSNKNPLSKALLLMNMAAHSAALKGLVGSQQQVQLLKVTSLTQG